MKRPGWGGAVEAQALKGRGRQLVACLQAQFPVPFLPRTPRSWETPGLAVEGHLPLKHGPRLLASPILRSFDQLTGFAFIRSARQLRFVFGDFPLSPFLGFKEPLPVTLILAPPEAVSQLLFP